MHRIILCCIIQQLFLFSSNVESLMGIKLMGADKDEFPFIASLQNFNKEHLCSGTLITYSHVITAAHCLNGEHPRSVEIVLGEVDLRFASLRYEVASWLTYRVWATGLHLPGAEDYHDIAIITLLDQITQPNVSPVRLTDLNKQQVQGQTVTIVGWRSYNINTLLKESTVNILSDDHCERNLRLITQYKQIVHEGILCTAKEPHVSLQKGDSGGPLLDRDGALIGVHIFVSPESATSWGNYSDGFTLPYRVNLHSSIPYQYYRQFIVNVTGYH